MDCFAPFCFVNKGCLLLATCTQSILLYVVTKEPSSVRLFFFLCFLFFFCILYIFIDWKLHTFFSQTNIVHINRQTRYIIYLHMHPTVPLNSILLLNIIQVQRSNNARFYIHLIVFILAPFHIMSF